MTWTSQRITSTINDHADDSDATASGVHFDLPFSNQ
jgi:hypothetical protein